MVADGFGQLLSEVRRRPICDTFAERCERCSGRVSSRILRVERCLLADVLDESFLGYGDRNGVDLTPDGPGYEPERDVGTCQ